MARSGGTRQPLPQPPRPLFPGLRPKVAVLAEGEATCGSAARTSRPKALPALAPTVCPVCQRRTPTRTLTWSPSWGNQVDSTKTISWTSRMPHLLSPCPTRSSLHGERGGAVGPRSRVSPVSPWPTPLQQLTGQRKGLLKAGSSPSEGVVPCGARAVSPEGPMCSE